ncbi:MAG: class I SAM-dependent methyltransferase [Anaerolineae bacterium]
MSGKLYLKRGKDRPLLNHHPWVFSGAISHLENVQDGETVEVLDVEGNFLARACYNSRSEIAARAWTFDYEEPVDREFFKRRIETAVQMRDRAVIGEENDAYRIVNAESDGLPGLVVDRYADFLVLQFLTLGVERHKQDIVDVVWELLGPRGIYERSDVDVRKKEGLLPTTGILRGEDLPERIEVTENGLRFMVECKSGHKTGFYLDQRENRERAASYLRGQVLNVFAYTGGFGVYAARAGASQVLNLDASAPSLDLARANFALNRLEAQADFQVADAFQQLRAFRSEGREFDAIVLDPPKFVSSHSQMERALRGYKDINLLAFQLLRPNGYLVTFSCSGLVSPDLFQKVIFGAVVDAQREGQIVEKLSQSPDHPISLVFPEAEYLKGLVVRVL